MSSLGHHGRRSENRVLASGTRVQELLSACFIADGKLDDGSAQGGAKGCV